MDAIDRPQAPTPPPGDLESVDVVLRLLECLAQARAPRGVSDLARELALSKPRVHRHLRALVNRGYVRQDHATDRYEIGVKLLILGESVRERFDLVAAARPALATLRDATGLAVTTSILTDGAVMVLDLLPGRAVIDFAVRPGSRLDFHASAHGLAALAFGPPELRAEALKGPFRAWTERTLVSADAVAEEVERVRARGWASAADAVQVGVNALAAPVFDHLGVSLGAIALVGSTQAIGTPPASELVDHLTRAAADASRRLGWNMSLA